MFSILYVPGFTREQMLQKFESCFSWCTGSWRVLAWGEGNFNLLDFLGTIFILIHFYQMNATNEHYFLTPRLSAWPLRGQTALSNFLEDILQPTKSKMSRTSNLGL